MCVTKVKDPDKTQLTKKRGLLILPGYSPALWRSHTSTIFKQWLPHINS